MRHKKMKKVFVISKTHLDLGFTDFAETVRRRYITDFIPQAIALAYQVNTQAQKKFIWTTGSWILKEALRDSDAEQKNKLIQALRDGYIVPHALPFTMHSELLDADTFDFGLSVVEKLDVLRGRKTVAAKMTDVPGHTKAIVPLLAAHGIKLLHIGVNGVSAVPQVPPCFLWKCGGAEVIVIYSGDYGGAFQCDFLEEILYFDHTLDNRGAPSPEKVTAKLAEIQKEYPDYTVEAGTLDAYAELLWAVKEKLPVFEGEIGDSWLHGSAADPYKSAALRELMYLKRQWLADGSLRKASAEYKNFSDALLCIAEHTCGMDGKTYFADYENYLKADFQRARKKDTVTVKHPFRDFPYNILNIINKIRNGKRRHAYSAIEKSWAEQRAYIEKAVNSLSEVHRAQAKGALTELRPQGTADVSAWQAYAGTVRFADCAFELNAFGGIGSFTYKGRELIRKNNQALLEYRLYTSADYDFWFSNYARDMQKNAVWGYPDFGRPLLKYADGKYPSGRFFYKMRDARVLKEENQIKIAVGLTCEQVLCTQAGAPREVQVLYTLTAHGLRFELVWCGKDANRLTEAIFLHLYPNLDTLTMSKLGSAIDYREVASMGGRNLHAVEKCICKGAGGNFEIYNYHAPLLSVGQGKILEYDNKIENAEQDGISYVLYDNVWGTNFPLWYEDNARFAFEIDM